MVTVVGGSGVFSGPTGAQYQQAGVEGLSGALAQQRAFAEQKRAQEFLEIYNLAKANADTLQVPISSVMSDPGFQDVVRAKLGNSMGGFLGIGGQRRLDQFLNGLVQTYGGQAGEEYRSKGDVATGRIVADTGQDVQTVFDQAGFNAGLQSILNPPAPVGVTPPPPPPPPPPPAASTPAPASTPGQLGQALTPTGTPAVKPVVAAPIAIGRLETEAQRAAAAADPEAAGYRGAMGLSTDEAAKVEEDKLISAWGYDPKTGTMVLSKQSLSKEELQKKAADTSNPITQRAALRLLKQSQAATTGTPPEAAGQSAGVDAGAPVDPAKLDVATLRDFWTKMYREGKVENPMAQVDTMRKLVIDNPGSYQRLMGGTVQGTGETQAAKTQAAPVGLEIPQKLGWSADDLALFRRFQGMSQEEIGSDPGLRRDYARFRQMNQQLKDLYTTETRKEIRSFKAAPGYEKDAAVQRSLKYLELTSPDNPLLNDPRFAAFKTDVTNQNIRQKEAMIRNELAQAGYTEAKIKTVVQDTEAASLMAQAEVLKARNEGLKAAYDGLDAVLSGLNDQFAKAMMEAKGNKAKEAEALAAYNNALANNPVLKTFWDSNVKLLAESNGMTIQMNNYMTQRAKFLQSQKSAAIPTASAFGASGTAEDQAAAALIAESNF